MLHAQTAEKSSTLERPALTQANDGCILGGPCGMRVRKEDIHLDDSRIKQIYKRT